MKCVNCREEIYLADGVRLWMHTRTMLIACDGTTEATPEPTKEGEARWDYDAGFKNFWDREDGGDRELAERAWRSGVEFAAGAPNSSVWTAEVAKQINNIRYVVRYQDDDVFEKEVVSILAARDSGGN